MGGTTAPERRQARTLEGILGLLGRLGDERPVVLLLEARSRGNRLLLLVAGVVGWATVRGYEATLPLLLVAPLYSLVAGEAMSESFVLIAALSVAVMSWSAFYNTAFDRIEGTGAADDFVAWMAHQRRGGADAAIVALDLGDGDRVLDLGSA